MIHSLPFTPDILTDAQSNISLAQTHRPSCLILIGLEHLASLKQISLSHPVIIIEPDGSLEQSLAPQDVPNEVKIIFGQWGHLPTKINRYLKETLLSQETGLIALKLMQFADAWYSAPMVARTRRFLSDAEFLGHLMRTISMVANAKRFHAKNQNTYDTFRAQPRGQTNLILTNSRGIQPADLRYFDFLEGPKQVLVLACAAFSKLTHRTDPAIAFEPDAHAYEGFLSAIQNVNPARVLMINRGAMVDLPVMLFFEEMLVRMGLTPSSFFSDWFSHMGRFYNGGWSQLLHDEVYTAPGKIYFTPYPEQNQLCAPQTQCVSVKLNYGLQNESATPPASEQECIRDIAIIHHTRSFTFLLPEANELFTCIHKDPNDMSGRALTRFFYLFRAYLKSHSWPLANSYFWRSTVNTLEYLFYCQLRVQNVQLVTQALKDFRVQVYGDEWDKHIPRELCGGLLTLEEVKEVYRTSAITLDLTLTESAQTPHHNVLACFQAGGFAFKLPPLFAPHTAQFPANLPIISSPLDLVQKTKAMIQNWQKRNALITSFQTEAAAWAQVPQDSIPSPHALPFETELNTDDERQMAFALKQMKRLSGLDS